MKAFRCLMLAALISTMVLAALALTGPKESDAAGNMETAETLAGQASARDLGANGGLAGDGMKTKGDLAMIKGGTFQMGSPPTEAWRGDDETPHSVAVGDFYLGRYEVTQSQYQDVTGANPSTFQGADLPVENLSWLEAVKFCNLLSEKEGFAPAYEISEESVAWNRAANGYRLPTEAEWEYACRGETKTPFNTESSISSDEANYYGHYPYGIEDDYFSQGNLETKPGLYRQATIKVGSFAPNKLGLHDMHGNVGEWVFDYYGAYEAEAGADPAGPPAGAFRVYRGGGWNDFAKNARSAYRAVLGQDKRSCNIGFRLARNAAPMEGNVGGRLARGEKPGGGKVLIAYYSWGGNTKGIAEAIRDRTGADLLEITLVEPYSSDYSAVLDEARRDQKRQARPAINEQVDDMESYDVILLGYPNWWASIPMPIATFLERHDFAGKTIIPFCSHGGGRLGQSVTATSKIAADANIGEPLSIHYSGGSTLQDDIMKWLDQNGVARR